jgi:L-lactate dehydrogenase complex protein LldE
LKVQIFIPCFIDQLYPSTAWNMVKVLEKAGCEVVYNQNETCCGQPAFNAGFWGEAKEVCAKLIKELSGNEYIVTPSASCAGFIKNYYRQLFDNSSLHNEVKHLQPRIFEFSAFMIHVLHIDDVGAQLQAKVTYHDSCSALRECHIKNEPRRLLQKVKGLELIEMDDTESCCGFGGTFAVKYEPISIGMAHQKITNAIATGASYIISTDMSCLMHLDGYIRHKSYPIQTMHIADVLASGW